MRNIVKLLAVSAGFTVIVAACAPAGDVSPSATPRPASTTTALAPRPSVPAAAATPAVLPTPASVQTQRAQPQPRYGGTLVVAASGEPEHFDAQQSSSIDVYLPVAPAYNNLLYYDFATGSKITPELAEQWTMSDDGLAYTFKIRQGLKFHNGSPLMVDDIVFNLERMKSPPKGVISQLAPYMVAVDKIEAAGADTVKVTMKTPFAPFLSALVLDRAPMFSKKAVEVQGHMKNAITGTGPFKYKSYTPGVSVELIKNPDYWAKGHPYLDGMSFLILKDRATRLAALRTGRAHQSGRVFGALAPADATVIKKESPGIRLTASPSLLGVWLFVNMRSRPFDDVRVRQAINLAVDRNTAIKIIAEGEGVTGNYFPYEGWGIARDDLARMPGYSQPKDRDIADARTLLSEAGYPKGFTHKLLIRNNEINKVAAVFVADQLSKIGVSTDVQILETGPLFDQARQGQFQSLLNTPATAVADPHDMGRFFAPKNPFNFSGNDDPQLNKLWSTQSRTLDVNARKQIIAELERYLMTKDLSAVPLVWTRTLIAVSAVEHGFAPGVTDYSNNRHEVTWIEE